MSEALYRKWRPQQWRDIVGQDHVVTTLQNTIRSGRIGHAYLFSGPRGTGKTSAARLLAKAANCLQEDLAARPCEECENCRNVNTSRFLDLIEIDAASNTSVEDVRSLREKIGFSPTKGRFKVYIIDEVHMLSTAAFNALLKTLEEPPAHAIFILATTEVHKVPITVISRCQRHEFRRISVNEMVSQLEKICQAEKINADGDALAAIARHSSGSMRDAVSLLDQLASTGEKVDLATTLNVLGTAASQAVFELLDCMAGHKMSEGLSVIHKAMDSGSDPRQFSRQVVDHLRNLLLIKTGNTPLIETTRENLEEMKTQAGSFHELDVLRAIRLFNDAGSSNRGGWHPSLLLELALVEMLESPAQAPGSPEGARAPGKPLQHESAPAHPREKQPGVPKTQSAEKPLIPVDALPAEKKTPLSSAPTQKPAPVSAATVDPLIDTKADRQPEQKANMPNAAVAAPPATSDLAESANKPNAAVDAGKTPGRSQDIEDLLAQWKQVRSVVKASSMSTEGLLNSSRLVSLVDNVLTLGFASEILRSKMENKENLEVTASAIEQVTGNAYHIRCVVHGSRNHQNPADHQVDTDGVVGVALNLGGKIVHKD